MFRKPFQPQLPGKRHQVLTWNKPWALGQDGTSSDPRCLLLGAWVSSQPQVFLKTIFLQSGHWMLWASWGRPGLWAVLKPLWSGNVSVCLPQGMQKRFTPSAVGHAEEFGFYVSFSGGYALSRRAVRRDFGTTCGCVRLAFLYFTILSVPGQPANSVRQSKGPRSYRLEPHLCL